MVASTTERFAHCIAASKRVRWDIDGDVIRGRRFDLGKKFLPDSLTLVNRLHFLSAPQRKYLSQVQGRTYANMFGLVERFINAKVLELSGDHWFGDQVALEALVRFSDEELKHQALFRKVEALMADVMPSGYSFAFKPNEVAGIVLGKSSWAVLALTLHIELFTQVHYRESIHGDSDLSELAADIFLFHWQEESQHAVMDELEWRRIDSAVTPQQRDEAVDELIELVGAVDGLVQAQAAADGAYFSGTCGSRLNASEVDAVQETLRDAYRLQYILSGLRHPHFVAALTSKTTDAQRQRIDSALSHLAPPMQRAA